MINPVIKVFSLDCGYWRDRSHHFCQEHQKGLLWGEHGVCPELWDSLFSKVLEKWVFSILFTSFLHISSSPWYTMFYLIHQCFIINKWNKRQRWRTHTRGHGLSTEIQANAWDACLRNRVVLSGWSIGGLWKPMWWNQNGKVKIKLRYSFSVHVK